MKLNRLALVVAGVGMFAATASVPAVATGSAAPKPSWTGKSVGPKVKAAAAVPCFSWVGFPTADNVMEAAEVTPGKPPKVLSYQPFVFPAVRTAATWYQAQNNAGTQTYFYGLFLQGGNLYRHTSYVSEDGVPRPTTKMVGSGWTSFKTIATSNYSVASPRHMYLYGLNSNNSLYRYAPNGNGYKAFGSFAGFKSFKTLTVISEAATYDTLLMTTTGGALYTVRIPVTATAKPVVKLIRSTGFATYESLVVQGCGTRGGSLVVAVDHDTDAGYQYAFSKANGAATAMTAYGKIPLVFNGVSHVSLTLHTAQLVGE